MRIISSGNNRSIVVNDQGVWIDGKKVETDAVASASSDETTTKDFVFPDNTASVSLNVSSANVTIEPQAGIGVSVKLTGPQSLVEQMVVKKLGSEVTISESESSSSTTIISTGGSTIVSNGSGIIMSGVSIGGNPELIKVEVIVPYGTAIYVDASGQCRVDIGEVGGSLNVDASGQSAIDANHVNGDVDIDVSGQTRVCVNSGDINQLKAEASGMSEITIGGKARNARLKSSGMSRVTVDHVLFAPNEKSSGMSSITVKKVG